MMMFYEARISGFFLVELIRSFVYGVRGRSLPCSGPILSPTEYAAVLLT